MPLATGKMGENVVDVLLIQTAMVLLSGESW